MAYDYVIVGAGSAGCVLADRLSEDPGTSVLLIEAGGPDSSDFIHMPLGYSALFRTDKDWDYMTGFEPQCNNRRVYLPRGRMLGGSSSLNMMVYMRGNRIDYDQWRDLGCEGWGWSDLLPYFIRSEDNERRCGCVPRRRWPAAGERGTVAQPGGRCVHRGGSGLRAYPSTTISTASRRTGSAGTRSPSVTGSGGARRPPTCARPRPGRTSRWPPTSRC